MDPVAFVENFQTDDLTLEAAFALWGSPHPEQIEADYFDDTVALFRPESDDPQVHLELEGRCISGLSVRWTIPVAVVPSALARLGKVGAGIPGTRPCVLPVQVDFSTPLFTGWAVFSDLVRSDADPEIFLVSSLLARRWRR